MEYVLFNELSNNKAAKAAIEEYTKSLTKPYKTINVIGLNYSSFLSELRPEDTITLIGGDGTLNHFINDVDTDKLENELWYYPAGSGNDFMNDVAGKDAKLIQINKYVKNLPTVTINGETKKFINGIGYGIDGWCCEEGDRLRAKSDKPVNYTSIAIKGLLFKFKRVTATVKVDGETRVFKHCWLAPAMHGRFYGGGMMVAPEQDRLNTEGKLTTVVYCGVSKLGSLIAFPDIFKGQLQKHKRKCTTLVGHEIEVSFDRPCALQIDGETVLGVTSYKARG